MSIKKKNSLEKNKECLYFELSDLALLSGMQAESASQSLHAERVCE